MNKIAIIEDDIDICNMIAKFLENNKYIVHYALNGAEGIELCKSLVPDLIILDIMLPRLNGNDVLQRLRKFTNAPVIVVSAKTMVQTKIDLLKLGADDYMTKPFDLHELLARIEANLKRTSNTSCQNDTLTYRDIEINNSLVYILVGENGAGKTTLIRLLTGLNFKSEGEIILFGHTDNLQYERAKIGCTIEMPALYKDMTASQNLEVQRIQRGIPNKKCIADTLELIGLSNAGKKRVANFSLGMKQRLALGVALLGEPEFLILDEPVNGLDPTGIIELRELLKKLVKEREVTILISSHILSELHQLATCYGFLHKGELLKQISAEKLNEECKRHICLRTDNIQKTTLLLEQKGKINNYSVYPDNSIRIYECLENVRMISKLLSSNGVIIDEISVQGENLETYFENLIGGRKNV